MGRVGGCEAAVDRQATPFEASQGARQRGVGRGDPVQFQRTRAQRIPGTLLGPRQLVQHDRVSAQAHHEAVVTRVGPRRALAPQPIEDARALVRQQRQRQHATRSQAYAFGRTKARFAVAAQSHRAHPDRIDHRLPVTDPGRVGPDLRVPGAHDGNVGGGAAHVGHHRILHAAEPASAEHAGGRTGQDRTHRAQQCTVGADQRSVALDHHQRRAHLACRQALAHRCDQLRDGRYQPRIERSGHGAPGRTQVGRQLVTAGHRSRSQLAHPKLQPQFMGRVAHREHRGDGKGSHAVALGQDRSTRRGLVQRRDLDAAGVVSAAQLHHRVGTDQLHQAARAHLSFVVAGQQHAHRGASPFHHRVGAQGGRQRHHAHLAQQIRGQTGQRRIDSRGQVIVGGQALGERHHATLGVQHDRVGIGATGVDPEQPGPRIDHPVRPRNFRYARWRRATPRAARDAPGSAAGTGSVTTRERFGYGARACGIAIASTKWA